MDILSRKIFLNPPDNSDLIETDQKIPAEIKGILTGTLETEKNLANIAGCFRDMPGTVFLYGNHPSGASVYNILALKPWLVFSSRGNRISLSGNKVFQAKKSGSRPDIISGNRINPENGFQGNPFDVLSEILEKYRCFSGIDIGVEPVQAGLFGYLSYDLCRILEKLPCTTIDDLKLPDLWLCAPSIILVEEIRTGKIIIHTVETGDETHDNLLDWFNQNLKNDFSDNCFFSSNIKSAFTEDTYKKAVSDIKELIAAGDVYQVNLSQRFEADFNGDAFCLFQELFSVNPASFYAFVNAGDHVIVSTSPERFVSRRGLEIETMPIKGTRPRMADPEEDEKMRRELLASPKDDAELSMIVDLMRNDFGRVAEPGSVKVKDHKKIESYRNVHHLFSTVAAELDESSGSVDFLEAVFPAGSITGCPKIRSMEIIDELEPVRRHIYTGSTGYIGFNDRLDLSVAIRTCVIKNEKIYFSAGGGVVFDSDPESEYMETLHKASSIMKTLGLEIKDASKKNRRKNFMWLNGFFVPDDTPFLKISDQGANGVGLFETVYAEKGEIFFLEDHLERFFRAWNHIFENSSFENKSRNASYPDVPYDDIIKSLLEKNGLDNKTARVRISAHAVSESPGYSLGITASPYTHRLISRGKTGLDLITFDIPHADHFAEFKTSCRLFYHSASKAASARGADEALILDPEGRVLETDTANIIVVRDKTVFIPPYSGRLAGVMEKNVLNILSEWGYSVKEENIPVESLYGYDGVYLTNALIGIVPVLSLDGRTLKSEAINSGDIFSGFSGKINRAVRRKRTEVIPKVSKT